MSQAISQGVVRLMRDYTGRGPTQVQTTITDNLVVVVLRDTLLKAERSLVADGEGHAVVSMRRRYQETMREDLIALVAEQSGREVEAFMSITRSSPTSRSRFSSSRLKADSPHGDARTSG